MHCNLSVFWGNAIHLFPVTVLQNTVTAASTSLSYFNFLQSQDVKHIAEGFTLEKQRALPIITLIMIMTKK